MQQAVATATATDTSEKKKRTATRKATIARHRQMSCRVYKLKLDSSHIGKELAGRISRMFLEAKWLYNHTLSQHDPFNYDYKQASVSVQVKVKDHFEQCTITQLSAQMRQDIVARVRNNLVSLARLKEKGYRAGRLKFKSIINSIPLRAHGQTYTIFRESNRLKIQGIKKRFVARGVRQIHVTGVEFANAALVRKPSGYYLYITTYVRKETASPAESTTTIATTPASVVGIDFGLHNQLALSNGIIVRYSVPVATRKVRLLHRELTRRQATLGRNWWKTRMKLRKAYEHTDNVKADIKNKIVSCLVKNFDVICIQRDDVKSWQQLKLPVRKKKGKRKKSRHRRWWSGGMKVLETATGGLTGALLKKAHTPVVVISPDFKSTEICSGCGRLNAVEMGERTYRCEYCKLVIDRDINAAVNIEREGIEKYLHLPAERRKVVTPVDIRTSAFMMEYLSGIPYVEASHGGGNRKPPCFSRR